MFLVNNNNIPYASTYLYIVVCVILGFERLLMVPCYNFENKSLKHNITFSLKKKIEQSYVIRRIE